MFIVPYSANLDSFCIINKARILIRQLFMLPLLFKLHLYPTGGGGDIFNYSAPHILFCFLNIIY